MLQSGLIAPWGQVGRWGISVSLWWSPAAPGLEEQPHWDAGWRMLLESQAKREINISLTVKKKKKRKRRLKNACNTGINVNLRWNQALNLLPWLVHVCPCKTACHQRGQHKPHHCMVTPHLQPRWNGRSWVLSSSWEPHLQRAERDHTALQNPCNGLTPAPIALSTACQAVRCWKTLQKAGLALNGPFIFCPITCQALWWLSHTEAQVYFEKLWSPAKAASCSSCPLQICQFVKEKNKYIKKKSSFSPVAPVSDPALSRQGLDSPSLLPTLMRRPKLSHKCCCPAASCLLQGGRL